MLGKAAFGRGYGSYGHTAVIKDYTPGRKRGWILVGQFKRIRVRFYRTSSASGKPAANIRITKGQAPYFIDLRGANLFSFAYEGSTFTEQICFTTFSVEANRIVFSHEADATEFLHIKTFGLSLDLGCQMEAFYHKSGVFSIQIVRWREVRLAACVSISKINSYRGHCSCRVIAKF